MRNQDGFLTSLMKARTSAVELIIVGFLLALAVNLISDSGPTLLDIPPALTLITGLVLGIVTLVYVSRRLGGGRFRSQKYKGFFVMEKSTNELLMCPRYDYAEKLSDYLGAAFLENEALRHLWDEQPLGDYWDPSRADHSKNTSWESVDLITEATEYYVLQKLTLHLSDYFKRDEYQEAELERFERNHIPDVLLSNRFLEMFSKPMHLRPTFYNDNEPVRAGKGVVYARGADGAIYDFFELILPSKTSIKRIADNQLEIDTRRFLCTVTIDFDAFRTVLPRKFNRFALKTELSYADLDFYSVRVQFDIALKLSAFFSTRDWDYYFWLESFLHFFERHFAQQAFLDQINYSQAATILEYLTAQEEE